MYQFKTIARKSLWKWEGKNFALHRHHHHRCHHHHHHHHHQHHHNTKNNIAWGSFTFSPLSPSKWLTRGRDPGSPPSLTHFHTLFKGIINKTTTPMCTIQYTWVWESYCDIRINIAHCLRAFKFNNNIQTWIIIIQSRGGGHSTFFQVGVCGPDIRSVGLANWHLPLKRGACELKISKFGGLWAKIWVKIEAVEAKISKVSQKEVLWTDSFAWNGTLASSRRGEKRGLQGCTSP